MAEYTEDCCFNDPRDHCIGDQCRCGCHTQPWPPDNPTFIAFKARYHRGANGLHTNTPLGFYADGWQDATERIHKANIKALVDDAEAQVEVAEAVAQMAAHDRDEALEQAARFEQEYERLRGALHALLPFAEEHVRLSYRDADVPQMLADPVLEQARQAVSE